MLDGMAPVERRALGSKSLIGFAPQNPSSQGLQSHQINVSKVRTDPFLEPRLFEEPMKVTQDRLHVGRPGGPGRDVDAFAEERGVQRLKTSPKLDGLYGR